MGRAPCCDKANVKRGPWSPEEDAKLKSYIESHGTGGNWIALPPKIGLKRCGKSCRLRWLNYLRPNIKHGGFTEDEDNLICTLYITIGSRWSIIAGQLPGRTDNDIKNYWNTRLKKKLIRRHQRHQSQSKKQVQNHSINGDSLTTLYNQQQQQVSPPTLNAAAAGGGGGAYSTNSMPMPAALEPPFPCNNLQTTSLVGLNTIGFYYGTCDALTTTVEEDQQPLCANSGPLMNSSASTRFMDATSSLQQFVGGHFRAFDEIIHERLTYRMPREMDGVDDNLFDMSCLVPAPALSNCESKTTQNWDFFDQPRLLGNSE